MKKLVLSLLTIINIQAMDQSQSQSIQEAASALVLVANMQAGLLNSSSYNQSSSSNSPRKSKKKRTESQRHAKIEIPASPSSPVDCQNPLQSFFDYLETQKKAGKSIKLPTKRAKEELEFMESFTSDEAASNEPQEDSQETITTQYSCNLCNQPFNSQFAYRRHTNYCFARKSTNRQMHMMSKTISKRKSDLLKKTDTALKAIEKINIENSNQQPIAQ